MTSSPKVVKIAYVVAFVTAALAIISALLTGPVIVVVFALIPLAAGIGIMRGRLWSAYGYALFLCTQLLLLPLILSRYGATTPPLGGIISTSAVGVVLIALYFLAGRLLKSAASERGLASPWIAISALAFLFPFFVEAFVIPSASMEETLLIGDHILVQRFPREGPVRDRLVVFHYPVDKREVYVRRVIGVPGDHIRISNKMAIRNGAPLDEPYAVHKTDIIDPYRDQFPSAPSTSVQPAALEMLTGHVANGEVIVPERGYFVLGDNRDNSFDSRYWGFVSLDDLIGRPILIYDSQARQGPTSGRMPAIQKERWNRLFKIL
jgi:signal peptidase I